AQGAAVAAADDHHVLRIGMGEQGRVRHHLVVEEVVAGGDHHRAIDEHHVAPVGRFVDLDLLEPRLHLVELAGDAETDRRAGGFELLVQPVAGGHGAIPGWRGVACWRERRTGPRGGAIVASACDDAATIHYHRRARAETAWRHTGTGSGHDGWRRRRAMRRGATGCACWRWRCWAMAWSPACCCSRWRRSRWWPCTCW